MKSELGFGDRFLGQSNHDDRLDLDTEISSLEALCLLWRCLKLIAVVPSLFLAKIFLRFISFFAFLLMPWLAKIVIDNVLLRQPFDENENPFPPFMDPILRLLEGQTPLEIMFTLTVGYLIGSVIVGLRWLGHLSVDMYGSIFTGQDETGGAENKISSGYIEGGGMIGLLEFWITIRLNQKLADTIRTTLFERLTRLPMVVLSDKRTGDSIYRVLYDTASIPLAVLRTTFYLFFAVLGAFVSMYLIGYSYGDTAEEIVWIAWLCLPLIIVLTFPASNLMRRINQNKRSAGSATTNAMDETVDNIAAVQSLGVMQNEIDKFTARSLESYFRERIAFIFGGLLFLGAGAAILIVSAYVLILITNNIIEGTMSAGDFGVLVMIFWGIVGGAIELGSFWLNLQVNISPARRIFFFIDYASDDDQAGGLILDKITNGITLDHVDYKYPDGNYALRGIDLDLPLGKTIALVGPSGAGKTSLAYLIPGFFTPTAGKLLIDGKDIKELDIDSVRNHITFVFQEHLLLAESIRDNLLLANPKASDEEILDALEAAGCMAFISQLHDGIDTVLGRAGSTLSIGQQQRLCIARGLVRKTKILILDEPTAALDPESESLLFESLELISKDRLVIIVAHRLSTIQRADKIVFLEEGRIVEQGSHSDLMTSVTGHYRRYINIIADQK
ncbi:MAG: ABC transporter ATP-binding protein [Pseudomonadota bacterium]|nr:ABC transporter ATP-binding protein [Pseudomonadota bacterium]